MSAYDEQVNAARAAHVERLRGLGYAGHHDRLREVLSEALTANANASEADEPTLRETLGARVLADGTLQIVAGLTGRDRALAFAVGVAVYAIECADRFLGWRAELETAAALALALEIVDGRPEQVGHGGRTRARAALASPTQHVGA